MKNIKIIDMGGLPITSKKVKVLFAMLGLVIFGIYIIFNGH
jgi:hypothetical protein